MGLIEGFNAMDSFLSNRENRRTQAKQRNQDLAMAGYNVDDDGNITGVRPGSVAEVERLQAQEQSLLLKTTIGKLAALETDNAIEDFSLTGDANRFQYVLDKNPQLKETWAKRGVQMVSNIDFENDAKLLSQAGLESSAYDTDEKKSTLKKNLYKFYDGKGWRVGMADQLAAETGAVKRLGRRAQPIIENKKQLVSLLSGPKSDPYAAEGHKYEREINKAAKKYDLPPNLVSAIMRQENEANDPTALGPDNYTGENAIGLMQVLPSTFTGMGYALEDIKVPEVNIDAGANYMRQMLDKYNGDVKLALAAYNAGPGRVDEYGGVPPFAETQKYVNRILGNINQAESYYGSNADNMTEAMKSKYEKIQETILNDQALRAQAASGNTKEMVEADIENARRTREAADTQNEIAQQNLEIKKTENDLKKQELEEGPDKKGKAANVDDANKVVESLKIDLGVDTLFDINMDNLTPVQQEKVRTAARQEAYYTSEGLKEGDKQRILELNKMIELSKTASLISDDDTGPLSNLYNFSMKYLYDDVNSTEARASKSAMDNVYRLAMAGTAQSKQEAANVARAIGTLNEKKGPVIAKLSTTLTQIASDIESQSNALTDLQSVVQLGKSKKDLQVIRQNIKMVLDELKGVGDGKAPTNPTQSDNMLSQENANSLMVE